MKDILKVCSYKFGEYRLLRVNFEVALDLFEYLTDDTASLEEAQDDETQRLFDVDDQIFDQLFIRLAHV